MVDGVVLAAGRSSRMARPKPELAVGTETFLERTVATLRGAGCRRVLAVLNGESDALSERVRATGAELVVNAQPESEQIDSLRLALSALDETTSAVLVLPVDLPLVKATTAAAVVRAFEEQPADVLLPFYNGIAGHPALLSRALFADILERDWEEGLRSVIMAHASGVREVRVNDPGVLVDIDTPDEYRRYVGGP